MGEFYFLIVIFAVYHFLEMKETKKQKKRVIKRANVIPAIADWFRESWLVLKKRRILLFRYFMRITEKEFVIPKFETGVGSKFSTTNITYIKPSGS